MLLLLLFVLLPLFALDIGAQVITSLSSPYRADPWRRTLSPNNEHQGTDFCDPQSRCSSLLTSPTLVELTFEQSPASPPILVCSATMGELNFLARVIFSQTDYPLAD